jgi:hypothetical protein
MNSQRYSKQELYPEDFDEDDKLQFDMYLEQSKQLFPKMANDEWLLKMGIIAYMKKEKQGEDTAVSQEEIAKIRNQYTQDIVFYTEPIEEEVKEITEQE